MRMLVAAQQLDFHGRACGMLAMRHQKQRRAQPEIRGDVQAGEKSRTNACSHQDSCLLASSVSKPCHKLSVII